MGVWDVVFKGLLYGSALLCCVGEGGLWCVDGLLDCVLGWEGSG